MLAVLGGLADVERDLIRTRTAEGRSRAKAQGKHMGRPPSHTGTEERGHQAARAGRYARRTRPQLQCEQGYDFAARSRDFVFNRVKQTYRAA
jgi:DNA invertase Pin-like site-specific DNA recombinase